MSCTCDNVTNVFVDCIVTKFCVIKNVDKCGKSLGKFLFLGYLYFFTESKINNGKNALIS